MLRRLLAPILAACLLALFGAGCDAPLDAGDVSVRQEEPPGMLADLAASDLDLSAARFGQTIYAPMYSQVLVEADLRLPVTVKLSIRNTDLSRSITLSSVRYYASGGTMIQEYLAGGPVKMGPMQTATLAVARDDVRGGEGANFVVEWASKEPGADPLVETVMVFTRGKGFAFVSRGVVIDER